MNSKTRLNRTDWIVAAFRALTEGGQQAIQVEPIARDLKVSKGSFYWHFKDVADLRAAMIVHWEQQATQAVIETVDQSASTAPDRLRKLFELVMAGHDEPYGGPRAEAAIRDWARHDVLVHTVLQKVDRQRIGYVQQLLDAVGQPRNLARRNARLLYAALLGLQQLAEPDASSPLAELPDLLAMILHQDRETISAPGRVE